jgi:hypothetical protein
MIMYGPKEKTGFLEMQGEDEVFVCKICGPDLGRITKERVCCVQPEKMTGFDDWLLIDIDVIMSHEALWQRAGAMRPSAVAYTTMAKMQERIGAQRKDV